MQLIFRGDPAELASGRGLSRQSITLEGVTFVMNEPRDASGLSDRLKAKLRTNSHFVVVEAEADEAPAAELDEEAAEAAAHAERAKRRKAKAEA